MLKPTVREAFDVYNHYELRSLPDRIDPVHYAGGALFVANTSSETVTVSIQESADGTTWTPVTFSTHTTAGNLTNDLVSRAYGVYLFETTGTYVRITAANEDDDPVEERVQCWFVQFPPDPGRTEAY